MEDKSAEVRYYEVPVFDYYHKSGDWTYDWTYERKGFVLTHNVLSSNSLNRLRIRSLCTDGLKNQNEVLGR